VRADEEEEPLNALNERFAFASAVMVLRRMIE